MRMSNHLPIAALTATLLLAIAARSDAPPSWAPFEICSQNGLHCARVEASDAAATIPAKRRHILQVRDASGRALWSTRYAYDGYPGGLLSDDGATFVYVNTWFAANEPVVSIYAATSTIRIPGSAFAVRAAVATASHFVWLDLAHPPRFSSPGRLELRTLDGNAHVVDTGTGKIVGN
jgi:hypothetical protein